MTGVSYRPWILAGASLAAAAGLIALLLWKPGPRVALKSQPPLVVFCAAGIKTPVEAIARQYEREFQVPIQLSYGGSQTLLANLELSQRCDLYLPADDSYIQIARGKQVVAEAIPLARMSVMLAVRPGNPKGIRTLADLLRPGVTLCQANPDAAAIGKLTRAALEASGDWLALKERTTVFKPTVNDVANDLKLGTVDAGFVWDATLQQYAELEPVLIPALSNAVAHIAVAVARRSAQPTAALRFARYLAARDRGMKEFARDGYQPVAGDEWEETPEIVLYSGAMNRVAVDETLQRFEQREGVRITRVYNGCGVLVGQMKTGFQPDAYLTCDLSFLPPVADLFLPDTAAMSESDIVMLVRKGNPHSIRTLADLAKPGLKIGVANPDQSTLGALTRRMLQQQGLLDAVMTNAVSQTPTADMLVNQMRAGSLDAVVVYGSNTTNVREHLDGVPLSIPGAVALQTFSTGRNSRHKQLVGRLLETLKSEESRARYQAAGFRWQGGKAVQP